MRSPAARVALSLALSAAVLGMAADARADGDAEGAKKHFEAGRKLRTDGDCTKAIPEFEQSIAADKSIGAYYNLGYCHEQLGHRQEAYDAYRRARDMASEKKDDRLKEISGALAALMETPNVRLVLPQPPPAGLVLEVDGELVPPDRYQRDETVVFTKSTPTHTVRAAAPGYDDTNLTVDSRALKVVEMKEARKNVVVAPASTAESATNEPPAPPFYRRRVFGGILGGVGVAAVTAGIIVAVKQQSIIDQREDEALAARNCDAKSESCRDNYASSAKTYNDRLKQGQELAAFVEVPLIVAGAAMIGFGVYILATAKSAEAAAQTGAALRPTFSPIVGPNVGGGAMSLRF